MMKESCNDQRGNSRKDCYGLNKTVHYDRDGRKTGETCESTNRFGLRLLRDYDRDGRLVGTSREIVIGFGFSRIDHYDRDGRKTGESRVKTG